MFFCGDYQMEDVEYMKYLGDILSMDGENVKNVASRKAKAWGSVRQILSILEETCFGPYFFEMAMVLRSSLLLNSMLTNSEAWYGLTKSDIDELEDVDLFLMRKIFQVPFSCPKEIFYLETGCLPISYIIKSRRVMFLHSILHEESDSMIYNFLQAQMENPVKGDWILDVKKNLEELKLNLKTEEIMVMSKMKFRKLVLEAVRSKAFGDLLELKNSHKKVKHISYEHFEMQKYLKSKSLSNQEAKFAFHLRSRMIDVRCNYSSSYSHLHCPLCKKSEDNQEHLLNCEKLAEEKVISNGEINYQQLFERNIGKQEMVVKILKKSFENRKSILMKEK